MSDVALHPTNQIGRPRISLSKIDAVVSEQLGPARVRGNSQPSALFRQIAMYLGKYVGGWSTTRIGHFYNGRDHSTVCYAIRRVEWLRRHDAAADALIVKLIELCLQDTGVQPIPSAGVLEKITRNQLDDALVEELADRIADRIASRLHLRMSTPSSSLQKDN